MLKRNETKYIVYIRGKEPITLTEKDGENLKETLLKENPEFIEIRDSIYRTKEITSIIKDVQTYLN